MACLNLYARKPVREKGKLLILQRYFNFPFPGTGLSAGLFMWAGIGFIGLLSGADPFYQLVYLGRCKYALLLFKSYNEDLDLFHNRMFVS
jgi:hypothetical protein